MAEQRNDDESLLVDFLLGRLDDAQEKVIRSRLTCEADLSRLHEDLSNTLGALKLLPEPAPPDHLVDSTLARIRQDQQLKALIARQEATRRPAGATFSLRELSAIAAAAILLAVFFIPPIRQAQRLKYAGECGAQAGQLGTAVASYANFNNGYLPAADARCQRWLSNDNSPAASNSAALFRLVQAGFAEPPQFQCPAVGGGSFVVKAGMADFPAGKFVSYSYQHTVGSCGPTLNENAFRGKTAQMAILADRTPLFDGGKFRADRVDAAASENHSQTGQNVLYMDGHVAWADKPTVGVGGDNIFLAGKINRYVGDERPTSAVDTFLLPAYSGIDSPLP